MKFAQDFHQAMNFTYDDAVFEVFVRMKILAVALNPFRDVERFLARGTVRAKGGYAKEGRKLVGHGEKRSGRWELVKQLTIKEDNCTSRL